jgi:hypothetical protein
MNSTQLKGLRADGERKDWQRLYIRNALASLGQISTKDETLHRHLVEAKAALLAAAEHLKPSKG